MGSRPRGQASARAARGAGASRVARLQGLAMGRRAWTAGIPQNGFEIDGKPSVEIYLNCPDEVAPEELITDIYMPVK